MKKGLFAIISNLLLFSLNWGLTLCYHFVFLLDGKNTLLSWKAFKREEK